MDEYEQYLKKAVTYLSYRPRSEKEIRDYLNKKKSPPIVLEQLVTFLTEHKFLNDEAFVRWWIDQRLRFRPKSKKVISIELRQKGIDQELIERVMQSEDGLSDFETAKKLAEKRLSRLQGLPKEEIYQKLAGYLARRGFNWETIKKSIDMVLANRS